MEEVVVVGGTGLCATEFTKACLQDSSVLRVWTFARRENKEIPKNEKLVEYVSLSDEWEESIPSATSLNSIFFSGIATTRAAAGGLEKQKLVDHDLQVKMAQIAKRKGYRTFVLISSSGANINSLMGYFKMKGEIERDIEQIGFDRTLILRPGPLLGRQTAHSGFGAGLIDSVMPHFYKSWCSGLAKHPVYASDVAKVALKLAKNAGEGVTIVEGRELVE